MNSNPKTLTVDCLEITDPDTGKVGIRLTTNSGVPSIELRDKDGFQRLTVLIDDYPKVVFHKSDGSSPLAMGGMDVLGYGIMVTNETSGSAVILSADESGELKTQPIVG